MPAALSSNLINSIRDWVEAMGAEYRETTPPGSRRATASSGAGQGARAYRSSRHLSFRCPQHRTDVDPIKALRLSAALLLCATGTAQAQSDLSAASSGLSLLHNERLTQ